MSEQTTKISKSMLIVKSDPNSLKGVEQFLKNRDWVLTSTHQMKDAILALVQSKPSFVLITVDHPNKKMQKLPKIIQASFPCCIMVYAEKATTASFKLLMDSGMEYKINPPITGPAIERAVNKYIRDREQAARQKDDPSAQTPDGKGGFEFSVEVKSGGEKESGAMSFKGGDANSAQNNSLAQSLLAQLGGADDGDHGSGETAGSLHYNPQSGEPQEKSGNGSVIQFPGHKPKSNDVNLPEDQLHGLDINAKQKGPKSAGEFNLNQEGKDAAGFNLNQEGKKGSAHSANQQGAGGGEFNFNQQGQKAGELSAKAPGTLGGMGGGPLTPEEEARRQKDILIGKAKGQGGAGYDPNHPEGKAHDLYVPTSDPKNGNPNLPEHEKNKQAQGIIIGQEADEKNRNKTKAKNKDEMVIRGGSFFNEESMFVKGVNQSLDDTVVKGDGTVEENLEDNSHLACIIVESPKFSGYLVAALGKNKKIDNSFVDLIRSKLLKFLKDNGEPIENESNMQVKVKRVDFEGWALEYAQFLRKSVHNGDEVAMAFFPFADAQTKVGQSAEANMVSVKVDEIQTEVPLEFNMYIYLPTNKKYVLYTPQNGIFLTEQKARLTRQGVSQVHIKKDDVQNLGKFKAQNHLNSLITDYEKESAKKKKKAA